MILMRFLPNYWMLNKADEIAQVLSSTGFGNEIGFDEEKGIKARLILKGPNADPRLKLLN